MTLREAEIRPDNTMEEGERLHRKDLDRLRVSMPNWKSVPCPACASTETQFEMSKYEMNFEKCARCATIFLNPRPDKDELERHYIQSETYAYWNEFVFPPSEDARRTKVFRPRVDLIVELCQKYDVPTNLLVEVGAGFGTFLEEVKSRGVFKRLIGIEPTPDLVKTCRKRGLEMIDKTIEDVDRAEILQPNEKIDVMASFEVIEHLLEPKQFVLKCASLLTKGGLLVLSTPNCKGFDVASLREKSHSIDPEHVVVFNTDSIATLLESCGFKVLERRTPGRLDAELVRKGILNGDCHLGSIPFFREVLIDRFDELGEPFQDFLSQNNMSGNMLVVAVRQ